MMLPQAPPNFDAICVLCKLTSTFAAPKCFVDLGAGTDTDPSEGMAPPASLPGAGGDAPLEDPLGSTTTICFAFIDALAEAVWGDR